MEIRVHTGIEGAKKAIGLAVMIDVFRASNTIISCLEGGARGIIPVSTLEEAYSLKDDSPRYLLFGERKGLPPEGFDLGNSPVDATELELDGKTIVFTTMAGSQGVVLSKGADEVIVGSFANAQAVKDYVRDKAPKAVSLMAMGLEGTRSAVEDDMCAEYIKTLLEGGEPDFGQMKDEILKGDGAARLRRLGQEEDLKYCLMQNITKIVPIFDRKLKIIVKNGK